MMLRLLNNDLTQGSRFPADYSGTRSDVKSLAAVDAKLGETVRAVYAAAKAVTLWPAALRLVCQYLGGSGAAVIIAPRGGNSPSCISHGISEEHLAELTTNLTPAPSSTLPGAGVAGTDTTHGREYWRPGRPLEDLRSRMPGGRQLVASLELQTGDAAFSALHRNPGESAFEAERIEAYAALVPHIEQALALGLHIAELDQRSRVLNLAADSLPCGRFVIDRLGNVMLMNRAARAIVAKDDGLRIADGRLSAARASDDLGFQKLLRESRTEPRKSPPASLALPRPSGAHAYGIYVTAMQIDGNSFLPVRLPAVEVTVIDPDHSVSLPAEFPRPTWGLTETECMLARRLACGEGIAAAAAHMGITRHTAYLHLEHIYRKAGVHGHAELVRALLTPFVIAFPRQDTPT